MRLSWKAFLPSLLVLSAMTALAPADETVADAYDAILRGDYRTGEALIARLEKRPSAEIERLRNWLTSFREVVDGRDELRAKTFQWNLNHAMEALEQDKVYLALTFAAQAAPHAKDADAYSAEPWIATLTERALAEASERAKAHSWTKVVSYYRLLARIHPDDKQLEDLFEKAMRHARLEILYADVEAVERRIEGVSYKLLSAVVRQISKHYYNKPDFKKLGEGALDYLDAICATHKLFDVFDGLGNPVLRAEFQKGLRAQRRELAEKERVSYKDLLRLYVSIGQLNKRSVELPEGLLIMEFLEGALERLDKFTSMIWPVNARDFDTVRAMLAQDARLDLVGRKQMRGADEVGRYFENYDRVHDWRMVQGNVEGRPAIVVYDPQDATLGPHYFVLIQWADGRIASIRDYRYSRHVITEAAVIVE